MLPLANLSDDELLERKISQLGLSLEGSKLQPLIQQLYAELSLKGLVFHPPCHIGDEWFVPAGIPAMFVPFFLTHDRLRQLERRMILEVEGETPEWFMKLIRHEAAHAYAYAYQLTRKRKWQRTFGRTSLEETPSFYRPRPYSRSFVVHLDDWYAQSHPDEDFAETFAVWLTPGADWQARYKGWKALHKLEYMNELMQSIAGKPPLPMPAYRVADYDCLNVKLKTYYARKRKLYADSFPDVYDNDLRQLFDEGADVPTARALQLDARYGGPAEAASVTSAGRRRAPGRVKASRYLRLHRREIEDAVCQWTKERKYRVNQLVARLIERCDELDLQIRAHEPRQDLQVSAYVTTLVMNHLFTGTFTRSK